MLSIYAEVTRRFRELYRGDDDRNEYAEILSSYGEKDQELWRLEAEAAWELRARLGGVSDFDERCEWAIMERFADQERERAERAA